MIVKLTVYSSLLITSVAAGVQVKCTVCYPPHSPYSLIIFHLINQKEQ